MVLIKRFFFASRKKKVYFEDEVYDKKLSYLDLTSEELISMIDSRLEDLRSLRPDSSYAHDRDNIMLRLAGRKHFLEKDGDDQGYREKAIDIILIASSFYQHYRS